MCQKLLRAFVFILIFPTSANAFVCDSVAGGGGGSTASGSGVACGQSNTASGVASVSNAFGYFNTASGAASNAFGYNNTAAGDNSVAVGLSNTTNGDTAIAIGVSNKAISNLSIAVGGANNLTATPSSGFKSIALGGSNNPIGTSGAGSLSVGGSNFSGGAAAIALGTGDPDFNPFAAHSAGETLTNGAYSNGARSIAIGSKQYQTQTNSGTISTNFDQSLLSALGAQGDDSIAIGTQSYASLNSSVAIGKLASSTGVNAIAFGTSAASSVTNGIAIGNGANSSLANSVALGSGSTATSIHTGDYTINGGTIQATSSAGGVVSVGSSGNERQIQNLGAGVVSASSTDAVNGSQLYAVGNGLNNLGVNTASALGGGSTYTAGSGVSSPSYSVQGQNYASVGGAFSAVDNSLTSLNNQVNTNTNGINNLQGQVNNLTAGYFGHSQDIAALRQGVQRGYEGTAVALATAGGNFLQENQKFAVTGKFGSFRGQYGIGALAQARLSQNVIAHAGVGGGLRYGGVGAFGGMTVGW